MTVESTAHAVTHTQLKAKIRMSWINRAIFGVRRSTHLRGIRFELNSLPHVRNNLPILSKQCPFVRDRFNFSLKSGYASYVVPARPHYAFNVQKSHTCKQSIGYQDNLLPVTSRYLTTKTSDKVKIVQQHDRQQQQQTDEKKIQPETAGDNVSTETTQKLGIVARFKLMFKQYWYVLIPVHCVTSVGWFGTFYYLSSR